jgi:hypothetical protein
MAEDTSFYSDQRGIRVTDKRVIIRNKTYVLANISSVSSSIQKPDLFGPIVTIIVGVGLLIGGIVGQSGLAAFWGVVGGVAGYFWYRSCKPIWRLRIASTSGESTPLRSINEEWIKDICRAINEAIVHRT